MIETVVLGVVLTIINVWDRHWIARASKPKTCCSSPSPHRKSEVDIRAKAEFLRNPSVEPEPIKPTAHPIPEGL